MSHRFKHLAKGRIATRGERNKTETEYEQTVLQPAKERGEILDWQFEPCSFRLSNPPKGQPARYTPDFAVLMADGTICYDDVKGSGLDDTASLVRAKCAAEQHPWFVFRVCKKRRVRDGGGFDVRVV